MKYTLHKQTHAFLESFNSFFVTKTEPIGKQRNTIRNLNPHWYLNIQTDKQTANTNDGFTETNASLFFSLIFVSLSVSPTERWGIQRHFTAALRCQAPLSSP